MENNKFITTEYFDIYILKFHCINVSQYWKKN